MSLRYVGPSSLGSLGKGGGGLMSLFRMQLCQGNCSGRGDCLDGICFCEVEFGGDACEEPNRNYFIAFASIFYLMCAVSMGQLLVYIWAEFHRVKGPSFRVIFRPTIQKSLYFIIFLASGLRAAYFSAQDIVSNCWASSLLGAYYAVILTGSSLIVCFWAEIFHLPGVRCERPRFLGKSTFGFLAFNGITYSLLIVEIVALSMAPDESDQAHLVQIFNGGYAVLMLIVVVFFLIYGVEVYFKVRGGFLTHSKVDRAKRRKSARFILRKKVTGKTGKEEAKGADEGESEVLRGAEAPASVIELPVTTISAKPEEIGVIPMIQQSVDTSQLQQSRFGLVSQAVILLATICFLLSDILGDFWKDKVPVVSRNWHAVVFRLVELAAALWFPCVLWNCIRPDQLWILNPKRIIKFVPNQARFRRDICRNRVPGAATGEDVGVFEQEPTVGDEDEEAETAKVEGSSEDEAECWICYDPDAGPLIHPCNCRGGVGAVHHDCLKRWLIELAGAVNLEEQRLCCRVCGEAYRLQTTASNQLFFIAGSGLGLSAPDGGTGGRHWAQTASMVAAMATAGAGTWAAFQIPSATTWIRLLVTGLAVIVYYVCLRFMGFSVFKAYYEARIRGIKILEHQEPATADDANCPDDQQVRMTTVTGLPSTAILNGQGMPETHL